MLNRIRWHQHCLLCGTTPAPAQQPLCHGCHADLPWSAQPVFLFQDMTVYSGFDYGWPINRLIHLFKYQARLDLLPILIQGLTTHATPAVDALVAVPMSAQRLRERGFNQAHILAKALGQQWGIPVWQGVERQRHTLRQQSLDRLDRLDNLQNAFVVQSSPPTRVMLIDDVFTTGSTLHALAQKLTHAGTQQLSASVIARVSTTGR